MCVGVKGRRNSKNQGVREEHADLNSQDDWGRDTQTETWWGRRLKKELWGSGYKTYRMQGETQSSFNRRAPKQNSLSWFLDCIQQRLNKKDFTIRLISPPPTCIFLGESRDAEGRMDNEKNQRLNYKVFEYKQLCQGGKAGLGPDGWFCI